MKESKKSIPELLKSKGFYIALYSSVAVMLSLAVVIGLNNGKASPSTTPTPQGSQAPQSSGQMLEPEIGGADYSSSYSYSDTNNPYATGNSEDPFNAYVNEFEDLRAVMSQSDKPITADNENDADDEANAEDENEDGAIETFELQPEDTATYSLSATPFDGTQSMMWPVIGEIVMPFSPEHSVYDITLEQYRTNTNICIESPVGAVVLASADGTVKEVGYSREKGNFVVIDNGNGWVTTYSQLQDTVLVKAGDVVEKGSILGGVAEPTIYGVLLGSHLEFKVEKDSACVDPQAVLVAK